MSVSYGIASTGQYDFDVEALVTAAQEAYPGVEVYRPEGRSAENVVAELYLPGEPRLEVALMPHGDGVVVDGAACFERIAELVAWIARTAPVPDDGSVGLIEWAQDFVPLRPDITASELLAVGPGST